MKIDFNKKGMTINFDKVPKFLYFNEEGKGCGQVFLDGVKRKGLQDIKIKAHTRDEDGCPPLKYRIQYIEPKTNEPQFISNMKEELCVNIRVTDTEEIKAFISLVRELLEDERIPDNIREEYYEKILMALNPEEVVFYAEGAPYFTVKEENHD